MIDEVEVTERGEIVARCVDGGVWTEPHPDGHVWMHIEDAENPRMVASAVVSRDDLAAWCRRVLAEVKPDPVPTVDEAAIRADEAEKIAAWMVSRARLASSEYREDDDDMLGPITNAMVDAIRMGVEEVAAAIRDGLHRSTP